MRSQCALAFLHYCAAPPFYSPPLVEVSNPLVVVHSLSCCIARGTSRLVVGVTQTPCASMAEA